MKQRSDMTHITIRLVSPPFGSRNIREIIRIKTPEKLLPLGDSSGSFSVDTGGKVVHMADSNYKDSCKQAMNGNCEVLKPYDGSPSNVDGNENVCEYVHSHVRSEDSKQFNSLHVNTENYTELNGMVVENKEKWTKCAENLETHCDTCGLRVEREEVESELYITRKDLATVQSQLETFKLRLEGELVERFKLEEELKSEAESHENDLKMLKEKIDFLEQNESEKTWRIEELESQIVVYKEEHEKSWEEVESLRSFVGKYQNDLSKVRVEANSASDQAVEAINEMELLTKKTEKNEQQKDEIKKQMKSEMEGYWKEVRELRSVLENWEKLDFERKTRIQTLENEVASYKSLVDELRENLADGDNGASGERSNVKTDSTKNEHLFRVLCQELNEVFREHLNSQGKFSELSLVLEATHKELEEARNRSQSQNQTLQQFKRNYNDLHDDMTALNEENRHLRKSLEKKCVELADIRRKFLASETQVSWLKEALDIVDKAKKKSSCKPVQLAS